VVGASKKVFEGGLLP